MKKIALSAAVALGLAAGGLGLAGVAQAQDAEPAPVEDVQESPEDGERDGRRGHRRGHRGAKLQAAADVIGIDAEVLREGLQNDQTVAEIATENGVDPDDVVAAVIAKLEARLDEKVAEGRLTQAEADEKLAEKSSRIEDRIFGVETADA